MTIEQIKYCYKINLIKNMIKSVEQANDYNCKLYDEVKKELISEIKILLDEKQIEKRKEM